MPSLLITNDFPPKVGGIQTYLYELWRRLPAGDVTVLTTSYPGAAAFDRAQPFRVERVTSRVLLPTPATVRRVDALAREVGAGVVFIDPALPLGLIGPRLSSAPYAVVLHGAEVTVPGRLPGASALLRAVVRGAAGIVAAGGYPAAEAVRCARRPLRGVVVPPGVDTTRFRPLTGTERTAARARYGLDPEARLVVGVSRLVPRKGFDVVIDAVAGVAGVHLVVAGDGRDRARLERRAAPIGDRVRFLGRVPDDELPGVVGMGDVFAMACRNRWGGLEQEGFGIVFVEAAACAVPAVAGRSGGAHEAVIDGQTGTVVNPRDVAGVRAALTRYLDDDDLRATTAAAARHRAETQFDYDALAARLTVMAAGNLSGLELLPLYAPPP